MMAYEATDGEEAVVLRRGSSMPILGFGTWQIEGRAARQAVEDALEVGYRHVDTATVYGNEREVGRALAASGLVRSEVFITTKLPGNAADVRSTLERSLVDLGIAAVDLWLLHWPPDQSYEATANTSVAMYEAMLACRDAGLARSVGVSNFGIDAIDELIAATGESPEVNQIPWGPFLYDAAQQRALAQRATVLEGYSPLKTSRLAHPLIREIASAHDVTPAQVVLRWHVQREVVVIPKSSHWDRIAENRDIFAFTLSDAELRELDALS